MRELRKRIRDALLQSGSKSTALTPSDETQMRYGISHKPVTNYAVCVQEAQSPVSL